MNERKEKSTGEHVYDNNKWISRDESEKMEWEEYYETRNKKLVKETKQDE